MPYFFASTSVANLASFVSSSSPSPPKPKFTSSKGRYKVKPNLPPNSMSVVSTPTPSYPTSSPSFHKSRPTCTLSLAHAHVNAASFAQGDPSASSLSTLIIPAPLPALPDRSELQSPIQEDRAHRAFRFPVPAKPAGEGMSFRGSAMKGKRKSAAVGRVGTNCIPFPTTTSLGGMPPSPSSSTTTTSSYSRSAASSTTSVSSCSSAASLELKLASFPEPPSTPPHVLLRVRQAQSQPKPIPASRARKLSGLPKPKSAPAPMQARSLLTLAAALNKATAPRMAASVSVPPASQRTHVPRLARRRLVDDRDGMGMERPGSPVPRLRGQVIDENDDDDAKQKKQKKEDEADLKSALTFELPPYSAPPPPYSPTVSPPPVVSESRALPTPPVEEIPIHAPVPKPAYVPPPPPQSSSNPQPTITRRAASRVSASEIRILLTLYRTVMVGLEKRYRAAEDVTTTKHVNGKEKAKEKQRFPLVEDDDDPSSVFWVVDDTEEEEVESENVNDEEEEYIPRRRPPPTRVPPNSPVGSPPSLAGAHIRPLSKSIHHEHAPTQSHSQKSAAELDVQDALLAIRLRGFLKAQGVSEAELDVVFDEGDAEEEDEDDETMAAEIDRALAEMHAASTVSAAAAAAENANSSKGTPVVVETSATPMEEGMHALPPPPRPRPCPGPTEKRPLRSSPSPPLVLNKPGSRNVAGGRTTSPSPPPSAAYMIALLTMRHRYASGRRSGSSSGNGAASKGYSSMGYPTWRRSSALKSVAWVAPLDEDEEVAGMEMEMIREQEEEEEDGEEDVDSVVELYAGMC